jgi:hypothetical protein
LLAYIKVPISTEMFQTNKDGFISLFISSKDNIPDMELVKFLSYILYRTKFVSDVKVLVRINHSKNEYQKRVE